MSAPIASYQNPGPDGQPETLDYHLNAALAIIGRDGGIDRDEQNSLAQFFAGVQQIGAQRAQPQAEAPPSGETEDVGSGDGTEDAFPDEEGTEPAQAGY